MGNTFNVMSDQESEARLQVWKEVAEEMLIQVYVPEADQMTREEALELALERDLQRAADLQTDCILHLEAAAAEAVKD